MPKLIYFSSNGKWIEHNLEDVTRIGRHPSQDLQLLDRMVSKAHAEIKNENGRYVLRDVGSRNGTHVNGELVEGAVVLCDGDEISLGNHILRFSLEDSTAEEARYDVLESVDWKAETEAQIPGQMGVIRKSVESVFLPESQIESMAELRRDYEKLRVGAELSVQAASTLDIDKLLNIIIDKAFQLFKADRIAILLRDENGTLQTRIAVASDHQPIENFKISERLLSIVINEKNAVLSADARQDERFSSSNSIIVDNIRSTMCVPLMNQDEVMGVINIDTQMMTGAFAEKDLQILMGFARQASLTLQRVHLSAEMQKNACIRANLCRIISPHLVDDVMSGKMALHKSGRRVNATVLFADIRGFSQMTEQNEPETIVNMLNDYFETMVDCIFASDGIVDKFVGDEVMAVWGVDISQTDHASRAVNTALAMIKAMEALNLEREKTLLPPVQIGIGIATGIMIAGYMGATQAMSYTVIGDTVNLASRLCAVAQGGEILVNDETWKDVESTCKGMPLPPIMVKGKMEPVSVHRIMTQDKPRF